MPLDGWGCCEVDQPPGSRQEPGSGSTSQALADLGGGRAQAGMVELEGGRPVDPAHEGADEPDRRLREAVGAGARPLFSLWR